nr:hypothetical protein [Tanacetum cinerariifolium]
KPVSSTQPEPKSAPAKTQGKKRKLTTKISDKPSKVMKSRHGLVSKRSKPLSSLRSVDESVDKDVPAKEPQVDDEEADMQRALEESLKSMYDVARDLLNLQTPKKKSPADRYIFQRCTSTPTRSSGHDESSSLYVELGLTDSEEESKDDVPGDDAGGQGQAGPDLGNAEASQPMPSLVVHAGSDREYMDLDVADVSTQPPPEQIDEGFTATAYPKVQENLKLTVEEHVLLEEPASSSRTLSSLEQEVRAGVGQSLGTSVYTGTIRHTPPADMKEILHQRMWETDSYKSHEDHMQLYEALEKSMNRDHFEELTKYLAKARPSEASGSLGAYGSSQVPPPPPSTNQESQSKGSVTPSSSKTAASAEYQTWMTTAIRLRPSLSLTPADLQMDEDMALDEQVQSSDEEYIGNAIFLR